MHNGRMSSSTKPTADLARAYLSITGSVGALENVAPATVRARRAAFAALVEAAGSPEAAHAAIDAARRAP